jgi:putative ABC transport system permease protein
MIRYMIVQNVLHRPLRTLITAIAVAVEVTMVIMVVGLTSGLLLENAKRVEGVGADIMIQPPSASVFLAFSGAPMPIAIGDKLKELDYVQAVAPVLVQFNSVNGLDVVFGIDPASFTAVSNGFVFHSGHDLQNPNDILVDDIYAKAKKVKTGQTMHRKWPERTTKPQSSISRMIAPTIPPLSWTRCASSCPVTKSARSKISFRS